MKLTINITGPQGPIIPANIHPTNMIFNSSLLKNPMGNRIRNNGFRPLTGFDMYYDLDVYNILPSCVGVHIDEIRMYSNMYNPSQYIIVANAVDSILFDVNTNQPILNGYLSFKDDLGFDLEFPKTVGIESKQLQEVYEIRYRLETDVGQIIPNTCSLFIVANNESITSFVDVAGIAETTLYDGGIMPIIFNNDDIYMFDYFKYVGQGTPYNYQLYFTQTNKHYVENYYTNISHTFPPRITFIQSNQLDVDFNTQVTTGQYIMDGRLKCNGMPIHYGQSFNAELAINGSITLDTIGLTPGTQHSIYVAFEGMQTGRLIYTST